MSIIILKTVYKHRKMVLASLFFFYLGFYLSISLMRLDCVDANATSTRNYMNDKIEYAVLVLTSPDNELKRNAIRATWGNFVSNVVVENGEKLYKWNHTRSGQRSGHDFINIYFVIGTLGLPDLKIAMLNAENSRTNDLVLLDFEDGYKYLAGKMLESLKWFSANFKMLKYLIKCDDDSFVRVDLIVHNLEAFAPEMSAPEISNYVTYKTKLPSYKGLFWGYFDGRAHVYLKGKWQEREWFLCDNYLPYALGGGYIISRSIVDYVARNSDFLSHYISEDVSMGVWTAALDGINRVHDTRFDTEWESRGCSNDMLVRHKQTPTDMFTMYKTLTHSQGERICRAEGIHRKSYPYKWNVLPSKCCARGKLEN